MAQQKGKFLRVFAGILLMTAFVIILFGVVTRFAGSWGVPYFSFQTENGSTCKNNLTGYVCSDLTLADLEYYGEIKLPSQTRMIESRYVVTHDYSLTAQVEIPQAQAADGGKALSAAYGGCLRNHVSPLIADGLTGVCVMANDAITEAGTASSRLYTVGTGIRKDGTRVVALQIRSR